MEGLMVKGAFHLQIEDEGGLIVGDSGWCSNVITLNGFNNYIIKRVGTSLTGSQVSHAGLGEGTDAIATNAVALASEVTGTNAIVQRAALTAETSSTSKTMRLTATFNSANSFVTATESIGEVGIFGHSTTASMAAGNTFATSTVATNQNVNVTYDWIFETA